MSRTRGFISRASWQSCDVFQKKAGLLLLRLLVAHVSACGYIFALQVKWWLCPPVDDYMPIQLFPYHPYKPRTIPPFGKVCALLFKEFLSSSCRPSPYLCNLVADYRYYQQRHGHHFLSRDGFGLTLACPDYRTTRTGYSSPTGSRARSFSNDGSDVARVY